MTWVKKYPNENFCLKNFQRSCCIISQSHFQRKKFTKKLSTLLPNEFSMELPINSRKKSRKRSQQSYSKKIQNLQILIISKESHKGITEGISKYLAPGVTKEVTKYNPKRISETNFDDLDIDKSNKQKKNKKKSRGLRRNLPNKCS